MICNFDALLKKIHHSLRVDNVRYYHHAYKKRPCTEYIFMKKTPTNGISKK
jgi:hypothetical protein